MGKVTELNLFREVVLPFFVPNQGSVHVPRFLIPTGNRCPQQRDDLMKWLPKVRMESVLQSAQQVPLGKILRRTFLPVCLCNHRKVAREESDYGLME